VRVLRLAARGILGLAVVLALSIALVAIGVLRSPFAPVLGGDIALARSDRAGLRVLFVGNSFTFQNSTPAMVHALAAGDDGARPVFAVQYVAPGWRLRRAARDRSLTAGLLALHWDAVVLQEASWIPSLSPDARARELIPFARDLDSRIAAAGSRTVLFMTWGYRDGDRATVADDTYEDMQGRLATAYSELGTKLSATVAPVGLAWAEALRREPTLRLWAGDGRHPSRLGSYLAACVLYATVTGRDPRRSDYTAGLAQSRFLQDVAADVVSRRAH
jgi:hypothetical protein